VRGTRTPSRHNSIRADIGPPWGEESDEISRLSQAIMSDIPIDKLADGSGNGFLSVTA